MNFAPPPRRKRTETLLPMINVVFLLLIFFLLAAKLTPPEPFPVTPPTATTGAQADGTFVLFLNAAGDLGYRDTAGGAVLATLQADRTAWCADADCSDLALILRADATLPAARLAALMPRLATLGFARVDLITARP